MDIEWIFILFTLYLNPALGVGSCSLAMPLRRFGMRLPSMPHLLLPLRQSSLRGTATMLVNSMGHGMYPETRTAVTVCGSFIRKMRHYGEPHPFALNGERHGLFSLLELLLDVLPHESLIQFLCARIWHGIDEFNPLRKMKYRGLLPS
jgi:hypothetical protein